MGLKEDWLKAVADAEPELDKEALTVSELKKLWNCSQTRVMTRIEYLIKAGLVQKTHKQLPGQRILPAYRLLKRGKV